MLSDRAATSSNTSRTILSILQQQEEKQPESIRLLERTQSHSGDTPTDSDRSDVNYFRLEDNLSDEEKEELASSILRHTTDSFKPLKGYEYLIVFTAFAVAAAACSTSKDFGDKFIEGLEKLFVDFKSSPDATKNGIAWGIAIANICAQFSLSSNSAINVLTRLLRSCQRPTNATAKKYEKKLSKKEKFLLATVPLSAFATDKMGYDTLHNKYEQSGAFSHVIGGMRLSAAAAVNGNFTYDQLYRWRGDNDSLDIVRLLKLAKQRLNVLANAENQLDFINALQHEVLFKNLDASHSAHPQLESILEQLLQTTTYNPPETQTASRYCNKINYIAWLSLLLGGLTSLTNFKAGTKVPELFGLPVAKDLVEFFTHLKPDAAVIGVAALGFAFGIPSWFVNTIINTRSCMNLVQGIMKVREDVRDNGFTALKKYASKEGALVGIITLLSIGYGAGNGGAGYKYPPVDTAPVPIINMILSFGVFSALGNLAQQGAAINGCNWLDRGLLERFKAAPVKEIFYSGLSPQEKKSLRRVTLNHLNLIYDTQISRYSRLEEDAVNSLFSPRLQQQLTAKFDTTLTEIVTETPPDPDSDPIVIRIDRTPTRDEQDTLTSIRIDPIGPQRSSPLVIPNQHRRRANSMVTTLTDTGIGFGGTLFAPHTPPLHPTTTTPHVVVARSQPASVEEDHSLPNQHPLPHSRTASF